MEETCVVECNCRNYEENIYWTRFRSIHFCQFLAEGFEQQLAIPEKFARNLKHELAKTVVLKGPSGSTWNVGVTAIDDALFFKNGWKEFVTDVSLEENHFLMFKYNGNSCFDVLIFDHQSLCEKESAYFVRRCGNMELKNGCGTKRSTRADSVEASHDSLHDDVGCASTKKSREVDTVPVSPEPMEKLKKKNKQTRPRQSKALSVAGKAKNSMANYVEYSSNRRPVTEEEKELALQLAQAASTSESFTVVMRPTHVYKRFYMTIPSYWGSNHLPNHTQDVILRNKAKIWYAKYYVSSHNGGLTGGWKQFAVENNLEEFDVCVFKLGEQISKFVVLDVGIFRVVDEVIPRTRLM